MAKDFSELTKGFSEERLTRIEEMKKDLLQEVYLADVQQALTLTLDMLAHSGVSVSEKTGKGVEKQVDLFLEALRNNLKNKGAILEVNAVFPDGTFKISDFSSLLMPAASRESNFFDEKKSAEEVEDDS